MEMDLFQLKYENDNDLIVQINQTDTESVK